MVSIIQLSNLILFTLLIIKSINKMQFNHNNILKKRKELIKDGGKNGKKVLIHQQ